MANPWEHFTAAQIAAASQCPEDWVAVNFPRLVEQMTHAGINERNVQLGMIGTIAIESASTFRPVKEAYYLGEPEPAETYRKTLSYYPFYGRGFIQLTHRSNYAAYGPKIAALWKTDPNQPDFNLVGEPDRALDPDISAAVAALYFRDTKTVQGYGIVDACRAEDWDWVRRLVYGGVDTAGTARIKRIADTLGTAVIPPPPAPVIDRAEIAARLRTILAKQDNYATEIHNDLLGLIAMTEAL